MATGRRRSRVTFTGTGDSGGSDFIYKPNSCSFVANFVKCDWKAGQKIFFQYGHCTLTHHDWTWITRITGHHRGCWIFALLDLQVVESSRRRIVVSCAIPGHEYLLLSLSWHEQTIHTGRAWAKWASGVKLFLCHHGKGSRDLSEEHSMLISIGYSCPASGQVLKLWCWPVTVTYHKKECL